MNEPPLTSYSLLVFLNATKRKKARDSWKIKERKEKKKSLLATEISVAGERERDAQARKKVRKRRRE